MSLRETKSRAAIAQQSYRRIVMRILAPCLVVLSLTLVACAGFFGGGEEQNTPVEPTRMSLPEFLKTALTPDGLTQRERMARTLSLNDKKVVIEAPGGGTIEGSYYAETAEVGGASAPKTVYTGRVGVRIAENGRPPDASGDALIRAIDSTPGMKLTKISAAEPGQTVDYYLLECEGREKAALTFNRDEFSRDLSLRYDLPAMEPETTEKLGR